MSALKRLFEPILKPIFEQRFEPIFEPVVNYLRSFAQLETVRRVADGGERVYVFVLQVIPKTHRSRWSHKLNYILQI